MNDIYLWVVTAVSAAVAVTTLMRLWSDRDRLALEELTDEDRSFAWRVVIFLVFPLLVLIDLRATMVAAQFAGGYVHEWTYGLFWYQAMPQGVPEHYIIPVLFAGVAVQACLGFSLLPALLFRPHPFLATVIGYTTASIFAFILVMEPLLSAVGLGGGRWGFALKHGDPEQRIFVVFTYVIMLAIFAMVMYSRKTRLWFADLSRPRASAELRDTIIQFRNDPENLHLLCKLGLAYEKAGLSRQAEMQLKRLTATHPHTIYAFFFEAVIAYRRRKYKKARQSFLIASDFPYIDTQLKASFLSASACSAFAAGETEPALNLAERALEFDDASLVARMVKVDVFLRTGKKEQAGEEILNAIRRGLDLEIEDKIPVDTDKVMMRLARLYASERRLQRNLTGAAK